ncbi:tetratricopeptide repeat protein [Sandaracinus amylolyticus]|uniref:tetratricopeptide repeat protein n=1 Tax=Sandaracinus amylolyticus TaxID=927083 RepID=UPI001F205BC8|nr:tetratricopeptide repeat protein [Sandaracinus amylolyticus]
MEVLLDEVEEQPQPKQQPALRAGAPAARVESRPDGTLQRPEASASVETLLSDLDAELAHAVTTGGPIPAPAAAPKPVREGTAAFAHARVQARPPAATPGAGVPKKPSIPPPAVTAKHTLSGGIGAPTTSPGLGTLRPPSPAPGGGTLRPPSPAPSVPRRPASIPPPIATPRARSTTPERPIPAPPRPSSPGSDPAVPTDAASEEARRTIESWERELAASSDPLRQARIHYEIGRIAEVQLQDLRRAAAHYQEALSRAPEHVPTLRGARRVMIARKNFQMALPLFDAEARITSDPHAKAALLYAKGRLLEDVLGQRGEARREYAIAGELDRGAPVILKALEQCDQDAGAWSELARTYERIANAVAGDPRHRAALIVQRARLLESRQREVDAAIELYETALRLDPEVAGALEALKRLHHAQRRWRDLIAVLEREAEQSGDRGVRTMALYRIARLHAERLGNRDEALTALERASRESPDEPLVLEEMARLYESAEKWDPLVRVLEQLVDTTREGAARVTLLARVGQLREEKLGDAPGALVAYEAALAIGPTHLPTLQALGKLYTRSGDWERLVRMHLGEADHADEPRRRAAAHARVAEILEVHLGQPDQAIEHHARALSMQPGYPPSFKALTRLFAEAGRWRELVDLYARAVDEASEKERAITYLLKMGAIYEDALQEHAQAAHAYRRVLQLDPKHLGAIHALQRATERAARWTELVESLELEAELTRDPKQIVALLHRAGEVLDDLVGDREAAVVRFRKVLGIDPTYVPALTSLGRIYHRAGRWEDLLELYKRELELTPRGAEAVALLAKMAELCEERIGRDDEAIAHYRRAIEIDPTNRTALRALARKLRERGAWDELVRVLEMELSGLTDPAARARAAYRVGEVWEERLQQVERAIAAYEQARDAEPSYRPAIDALARLRAEQGAWRKLADELEREAASSPDPKLAVAALVRAGEIWSEHLNEPRRACAAYDKVLEREPGHLGALLAIETLYRRLASFEGLARVYASEARVLTDASARVAALHELARLQEMRLAAPTDEVRATYQAILSLAPDDPLAIAALERIAIAGGSRSMLADVDRRLAEGADDPIVAAAYRTRLAESLEASGDARALEAYRAALEADPENLAAARGLSRIAERTDDPEALADAARREARVVQDPQQAARLLVKAAQVAEDRLADTRRAVEDYERALELWADDVDAAQRLLEILLAAGQGARAADRLARAAQTARSVDRAAELWLEVSRLQADLLDNLAGAIGSLNRVLKSAPAHVPTLRRLAELYERDQQWTEAAQLLGRVVQLAPDRDVLKDAHLRLSALWDGRLGDSSRALVSLQAVLALEPENRAALARLAAMHDREGDLDKAADAAGRLVEASHAPPERAEALCTLARIELRRGRTESATSALVQAVVLEGPGGAAARALKDTIRDREGYATYAQALRDHVQRWNGKPPAPRQAWVELAGVLGDSLGQHADSAEVLRVAARALPEDVELDRQLAARLARVGRRDEAVAILRRRIDEHVGRVECWRDLRGLWSPTPELAMLTVGPLALLGGASNDDVERLRARASQSGRARPGTLGSETLPGVYEMDANSPVLTVLATLPEAFSRLYPPDLEGFGLSTRDRITTRSGHPLRALTDRIAAIFRVENYELYVHRVRARGLAVELGEPASILVPASLTELPETQQVFLLARAFANVAMRFHITDKLTPREIEVLVASAVRAFAPGFGSGLTSEDILDDQMRRIQKALSRRARRSLEEATPRYVNAPPVEFAAWARQIQLGSARAALLVSDDLLGAIEVLRRTERDLAHVEPRDIVRASPLVGELVRWWASDAAIDLRRRAGMLA